MSGNTLKTNKQEFDQLTLDIQKQFGKDTFASLKPETLQNAGNRLSEYDKHGDHGKRAFANKVAGKQTSFSLDV